jgi:hypothetical protein
MALTIVVLAVFVAASVEPIVYTDEISAAEVLFTQKDALAIAEIAKADAELEPAQYCTKWPSFLCAEVERIACDDNTQADETYFK